MTSPNAGPGRVLRRLLKRLDDYEQQRFSLLRSPPGQAKRANRTAPSSCSQGRAERKGDHDAGDRDRSRAPSPPVAAARRIVIGTWTWRSPFGVRWSGPAENRSVSPTRSIGSRCPILLQSPPNTADGQFDVPTPRLSRLRVLGRMRPGTMRA